ncbi:MAG: antitoxin [Desulfarculaceae bacterium]|nr:antitoxin [Desulfarculaceae bacterium]MCF8074144.1 antitoxin [Desulfarculaceae bacterium]MCF8103264.1 antitoxin [Desulfarculaceae bacterium]MCF8116878.1 antitoxin [Desulfarculaceae bacterium]
MKKAYKGLVMTLALALTLGGAVLMMGCESEGPAEKAGKKVDQAVEKAGEKVEEATDKMGDTMEKAGDKVQDATNN